MTKHIYLDYAATTPMDREVKKAMEPYLSPLAGGAFGNPNSLHYFGQQARKAVDESREKVAKAIGADFREVIFTGSATESNNMALRGVVKKAKDLLSGITPRIIVSSVEHESVLETARDLEGEGVEVVYLPVDKSGRVNLKKLEESLNENTILVSVMYANNEIGNIQPISEISNIIKNFRNELLTVNSKRSKVEIAYPLFHSDAVQAFQFLNCNVDELGVDLMTLSAHKIYGPKGMGALYIRNLQPTTYNLQPIITGGKQEFNLRSGTENVAGIIGFAKAIELAEKSREKETRRLADLRNYFWAGIEKIYPKAQLNGFSKATNLPSILNIYFPGHRAEDLLIKLDLSGVAVSSGSACASYSAKPSHVLEALGYKEERTKSSLRFSMGKFTNKDEIARALKILKEALKK